MICYAVIDTNVLVSSLLAKSADVATVQIMEKVIESNSWKNSSFYIAKKLFLNIEKF